MSVIIRQVNDTPIPHNSNIVTLSDSKDRKTTNDLSRNLIQNNTQKLNLIKVDKTNSNIRNYFTKYSQIAPERAVDRMSMSFVDEVNSEDFFTIYPQDQFRGFSIVGPNDIDRLHYSKIFHQLKLVNFAQAQLKSLDLKLKQSRAIGSMLGLAICDALGAPLEFASFRRNGYRHNFSNFAELQALIQQKQIFPKFGQAGIWTDDFSMALALSYNMMESNFKFNNPQHLRFMFHLWWYHGLGNGDRLESVGLGRNISISMDEFVQYQRRYIQLGQGNKHKARQMQEIGPEGKYNEVSINKLQRVKSGNQDNNGNGSLMRLAPCAVLHYDSVQKAMQVAAQQSLTTHNGLEARECCRLLAKIIVDMINRPKNQDWRQTLFKSCGQFKSSLDEVQCLARGEQQTQEMFDRKCKDPNQPRFKQFNRNLNDRKWNWRDQNFNYSPTRYNLNFEYIGSYCMDGLAMALHCVYHTNSFKECALKCAKMGGDCDTVGAIAGQIAGAVHGVNEQMLQLYSGMDDFKEGRFDAFLVAKKLVNHAKPLDSGGFWNWILQKIEFFRRILFWC